MERWDRVASAILSRSRPSRFSYCSWACSRSPRCCIVGRRDSSHETARARGPARRRQQRIELGLGAGLRHPELQPLRRVSFETSRLALGSMPTLRPSPTAGALQVEADSSPSRWPPYVTNSGTRPKQSQVARAHARVGERGAGETHSVTRGAARAGFQPKPRTQEPI